jgi:hypothetical protein
MHTVSDRLGSCGPKLPFQKLPSANRKRAPFMCSVMLCWPFIIGVEEGCKNAFRRGAITMLIGDISTQCGGVRSDLQKIEDPHLR